ncbi:hypothetical protein E3N88_42245 [Mikania micrantha]|uniref:Uncharacterized protein n=1 Tax=Mikania micrantha TaxID=192012 RepID=A0A5N6LKJ9_9ASTR|nr:hypothetical protein E3N88_42245 [Mikania micrantha]
MCNGRFDSSTDYRFAVVLRMSSGDDHFINHHIPLVILSDSNTDPSEHSDSSTDSRRQSIPMPPPPVMPVTRDYPRGRGRTRATARKTTGLPSRRHLLPGQGTSNAAQLHGLPDAMRHQLQANFVPRGEFHTWSNTFRIEFDH